MERWLIFFCLLILRLRWICPLKQPWKVVIVGADTPVGSFVISKLLRKKSYETHGLVSNVNSLRRLVKNGVPENRLRVCDITQKKELHGAFDKADKAVICTSAIPCKRIGYSIKSFLFRLVGQNCPSSADSFYYAKGRRPYEVDYIGQKNIVDECVKAKVQHVVLLGSMGGYRGSKMNDIGRCRDDPDLRNGNILKWKRAAERYLMKRSMFTILHAAKLTDEKGGCREIIWDTDDALLRTPFRRISKEDATEAIVQALQWKEAIGRSIDIASRPWSQVRGTERASSSVGGASPLGTHEDSTPAASAEDSPPKMDWLRFWSKPGDCVYPADGDDLRFHS